MPIIPPCGPPCDLGAFDSSDPSCNMPFIPKINQQILDDCIVPKAPESIWEVTLPDFPLPPNMGFQCAILYPKGKEPAPYTNYNNESHFFTPPVPRTVGIPKEAKVDVITGVPSNPNAGDCDFTLEVNVPCIQIYPAGEEKNFEDHNKESTFIDPTVPRLNHNHPAKPVVTLVEPENIDRTDCDFNLKVDVPCIQVYPVGKEPGFVNPLLESKFIVHPGGFVPKIDVKTSVPSNPLKTICDFNLEVDVPCITVHPVGKEPGFVNQLIESRLIQPPPVGRESIVNITKVVPDEPFKSPCDFNIQVDVPCITVKPAGFYPVNEPLKSKVELLPIPDPTITVRIEPSTRTNKGECDFDIGIDIALPESNFCVSLRTGQNTVVAPAYGACTPPAALPPGYTQIDKDNYDIALQAYLTCLQGAGAYGGCTPPTPVVAGYTQAQLDTYDTEIFDYATCLWSLVEIARGLADTVGFLAALDSYENNMDAIDVNRLALGLSVNSRYIIADYYPSIRTSNDYIHKTDSSVTILPGAVPSLNMRLEETPLESCAFTLAPNLILPDFCATLASGKGDPEDPGAAPPNPGPLPTYPTDAEKQTFAEYWWWPAQNARKLRALAAFTGFVTTFEANVPEPIRHLIPDYYGGLIDNVSYEKPQQSTAKYLPGLKDPKISTHIEKEDPQECVMGISMDLVLPCVSLDTTGSENNCPDPGVRPPNPGPAPDPITIVWRIAHAEYWWWLVEVAKFNQDEEDFDAQIVVYEANVILADRYLIQGYSVHLVDSLNKMACQNSKIEIVPDDEPASVFIRVEQPDPDKCEFTFGIDIKVPTPPPSDAVIPATPFQGHTDEYGDIPGDTSRINNGCIIIQLDDGRTQNLEIPASTLDVVVGDQLVVKVRIKEGAIFDEVDGYAVADIIVEYTTEASDLAAAWEAQPPGPAAAQPEIVVPILGAPLATTGKAKNGGTIVGYRILNGMGKPVWIQVLNDCVQLNGRTKPPVNFRGIKTENGGAFDPAVPGVNIPNINVNQGAVLIAFEDRQNKPWLFQCFTPAVVTPGNMVILDIILSDTAYVAVPDNSFPGGIRYDFDDQEVTINCSTIALGAVDNDQVNLQTNQVVGTSDTVGVIGIYYAANHNGWPQLAVPFWIQKHEGIFTYKLQKPVLGNWPTPLAPGTVLTSGGVNQIPYWDYPRYQ